MNSELSKNLRKMDSAPPSIFSFSQQDQESTSNHYGPSKVFTPRVLQRNSYTPQGGQRVKGLKHSQSAGGPRKSENTLPKHVSHFKTEICRSFMRDGTCQFGDKCDFAHGVNELRYIQRHPKYKTKKCKLFHETGVCPYGSRCSFVHEPSSSSQRNSLPPTALQGHIHRAVLPGPNKLTKSISDLPISASPWRSQNRLSLSSLRSQSASPAYRTDSRKEFSSRSSFSNLTSQQIEFLGADFAKHLQL